MKRDLFRFFIGVITIWIWLPCIIIGGVIAIFTRAGEFMIQTTNDTKDEFKEFFTSDKMVHVIHNIVAVNEAAHPHDDAFNEGKTDEKSH